MILIMIHFRIRYKKLDKQTTHSQSDDYCSCNRGKEKRQEEYFLPLFYSFHLQNECDKGSLFL